MCPLFATKQRCVLQETMKYFIRDKHTRQKAAAARGWTQINSLPL